MLRIALVPHALSGEAESIVSGLDASIEVDGEVGIIRLVGEMRVECIPSLDEAVAAARAAGARHLLLDLGLLDFMDSASAGTLLRIRRDQLEADARLVLFSLRRMVARLIDAAGLASQFDLAADEEAARIITRGL